MFWAPRGCRGTPGLSAPAGRALRSLPTRVDLPETASRDRPQLRRLPLSPCSTLLCVSSRRGDHGGGEGAIELTGDVALKTTTDLTTGPALRGAPGDIGRGLLAGAHSGPGDDVQRA